MKSIPSVKDISIYPKGPGVSPARSRGLVRRASKHRLSFGAMRAVKDLVTGGNPVEKPKGTSPCSSARRNSTTGVSPPRNGTGRNSLPLAGSAKDGKPGLSEEELKWREEKRRTKNHDYHCDLCLGWATD